MHSKLDQHPNQHLKPPQHNKILRYAQDLQQLLFHLLILQRRHTRKSTLQTDQVNITTCLAHIQTTIRGFSGTQ
jgi:hypothetical protein